MGSNDEFYGMLKAKIAARGIDYGKVAESAERNNEALHEKWRQANKRRLSKPENRAKRNAYMRVYSSTDEFKAKAREYMRQYMADPRTRSGSGSKTAYAGRRMPTR